MARAVLLAWSNPVEGREAEFQDWYDNTHIPELRALAPSMTTVNRYRLADVGQDSSEKVHRFLTVYELDTTDVASVMGAIDQGASAGKLHMSSTLDRVDLPPVLRWYVAL